MTSRTAQAAPSWLRSRRDPSATRSAPAFNDRRTAETRPSRVAEPYPLRALRRPSATMTVPAATGTLESP